jgi:hypothetical protein
MYDEHKFFIWRCRISTAPLNEPKGMNNAEFHGDKELDSDHP